MAKEAPFHREKTSQNLRGVSEGSREPLKEEEEAGAGVGGASVPQASRGLMEYFIKRIKGCSLSCEWVPTSASALCHQPPSSRIWNPEVLEPGEFREDILNISPNPFFAPCVR